MKTYRVIKTFVPVAGLTLLLAFASCGKKKQAYMGMEQTVGVATVKNSVVKLFQEYPATLVSNKQIKLVTDVGGRVENILFKEGSHVTRGQPLYDIDKSLYEAAHNAAVAQLKVAQTNLQTAQTDLQRYQNLWDHNAVDQITLAHAQAQVEVSKSQVEAAEAAVASTKTNLEHATIVAPFSGSTNVSTVRLGDLVVANLTVLVTIVDNSSMRADFYIPEAEFVSMVSEKGKADPALPRFMLILPDGSPYPQGGKLDFVDSTVDPTTGTILVRLIFPNPRYILKSGMNCVVRSQENTAGQQFLVIPQEALQQILNEYHVYVVSDSGVVEDKKIEIGPASNGLQIVTGGLTPGQKVVVEGIEKVRPHQHVKTVPYRPAQADTTRQSKMNGKK
ncbi:MAG: efflux RND transporter periplasmic adaptor subunit [Calditrichota bacterium]|jgi:membrane fusion protein (multidrug efflux system)